MIISFFEEYPTKSNLNKLKLIKFQTKLYLASSSFSEFKKIKSQIKSKYVKEIIYWPILKKEEGYWFSPFSERLALRKTLNEIPPNQEVMIDLELPTTQNPRLYFTEFFNFFRNKKLISNFIKTQNKVYTAEYFPNKTTLKFLGLNYNPIKYKSKVIKMFYTSMWPFPESFLDKKLKENNLKFNSRFIAGFGTIATGQMGNEPILSLKNLERDLTLAKKNNIKEIVIFRLGGLNKNYIKSIKKFI